jgi:AcrR family transcriptional regulator
MTGRVDVVADDAAVVGLSDTEIVRVAREMISELGVDGLSMRRLSAKLGVALGATYHHVPTKHRLLVLVGQDLYGELTADLLRVGGRWDARLRAFMIEVAAVVSRHPGMANFLMANLDEVVPTELNGVVVGILAEAGFADESVAALLSALFFFATGMSAGSSSEGSAKAFADVDIRGLFEAGLDMLLTGARARLAEDRKARRAAGSD